MAGCPILVSAFFAETRVGILDLEVLENAAPSLL
jgi:hypothetical protein